MLPDRSVADNGAQFQLKGEQPYFAEERPGWKGYVEWEVSSLPGFCDPVR